MLLSGRWTEVEAYAARERPVSGAAQAAKRECVDDAVLSLKVARAPNPQEGVARPQPCHLPCLPACVLIQGKQPATVARIDEVKQALSLNGPNPGRLPRYCVKHMHRCMTRPADTVAMYRHGMAEALEMSRACQKA